LAVARKQFHGHGSAEVGRPSEHASPLARVPNADRQGWIARPEAGGSLAAGGQSGSPPRPGESAAPRRPRAAQSAHGLERSAGDTATVVDGGGRGGRSFVGSSPASGTGSAAIRADAAVPVKAFPVESAKTGERHMDQGTGVTEVRALGDQPLNEPDKPKDAQADPEGVVLQLSFNKTTQPEKGDTTPVVDQGVTLDSVQGAHFSADSQFVIPDAGNLNGEAGTISFTLQPEWGGDDTGLASLLQLHTNDWANRLQIFKDGPYLRFLFTPDTGIESNAAVEIKDWQPGQSYQITTTWGATPSGDRVASLYVNGQLVSQQPYDGQLEIPPGTPLYIGSDVSNGQPGARGTLSDFKVYNNVQTPGQIAAPAAGTTQ
jgi:hypothetical protein